MPRTNYKEENFDIDLDFGHIFENKIVNIFEGDGSIEVKTEDVKNEINWKTSGNIAIEYRYKGVESGISMTNAKWWIHILSDGKEIEMAFIFPVDVLKKKIRTFLDKKIAKKARGGDNNNSSLVLLPISKLHKEYKL